MNGKASSSEYCASQKVPNGKLLSAGGATDWDPDRTPLPYWKDEFDSL
jgi:hypothetical protein